MHAKLYVNVLLLLNMLTAQFGYGRSLWDLKLYSRTCLKYVSRLLIISNTYIPLGMLTRMQETIQNFMTVHCQLNANFAAACDTYIIHLS